MYHQTKESDLMDKIYGVVLIGCGYIGEEHLSDIYYQENVRVVAVVDRKSVV